MVFKHGAGDERKATLTCRIHTLQPERTGGFIPARRCDPRDLGYPYDGPSAEKLEAL